MGEPCPFSVDMDCAVCHEMQPYVESLENPEFLAGAHAQAGYTCVNCHVAADLQGVHGPCPVSGPVQARKGTKEECFRCHMSYAAIRALTVGSTFTPEGINPHDTHLGEIECSSCHSVHNWSRNLSNCYGCHHEGLKNCNNCHE